MSTNQQNNKTRMSETFHGVVDSIVEKGEAAVEKVKEWAGVEITDDIDQIKKKATKQNAEQVHLKDEMQHELKIKQKEEEPVAIKEEYKEQREVIEKAQLINSEQAERKEEMQKELKKENKEAPSTDDKTMMDKMKEKFDKQSMNEAMDKVKEVWGTTTTKLTEKTGEVVEKVKEIIPGMENNDPEKIKGKAMKANPEQARMKQDMQRELLAEQQEANSILLSSEQEKDIQKQRKQEMKKELTKENKQIPAFDAKISTMDKAKEFLETTTNTISEKSGSAVEKVKEWTGMKDAKETVQQVKDNAIDKNPEQAQMKQQMQKELLQSNVKNN